MTKTGRAMAKSVHEQHESRYNVMFGCSDVKSGEDVNG